MVNTVSKGANRAAAKARRDKAAQRTPLPRTAKQMTDPEGAGKPFTPTADSKSKVKADDFIAAATESGWTAVLSTPSPLVVHVKATRGPETITIGWLSGVFIDNAEHTCEGHTVKMRNAMAAKRQMTVPAQEAIAAASKVSSKPKRKIRLDDEDDTEPHEAARKHVPFDAESTSDEEVFAAVVGRTLIWKNRTTGLEEQATVLNVAPENQRHLEIVIKHNRRILNFTCEPESDEKLQGITSGSFRSVYLDAIRAVV